MRSPRAFVPGEHTAGPDDLAVLPYTSGTTGKPKGCIHPHSTIMCTAMGGAAWANGTSDAVVLGVLPMFHVTGMQGNMNTPIILGATVVMMTRWDRDCAARTDPAACASPAGPTSPPC